MKIQVLGSGCSNCKKFYDLTVRAVKEMNLDTKVEYITDIQQIIDKGVMSTPVLVVNDEIVSAGSIPSVDKIKNLIKEVK